MVVTCFHKVRMLLENQISRRYFRDIVGSSLSRVQRIPSGP